MKCTRCNKNNTSKIDQDGRYIYCLDCNFTFKTAVVVKTGTVEFPTSKFLDDVKKMELASPQERAILEAGLTGEFMEQWFEGFKAGQMASIVHARKYYDGKNRDDNKGSDSSAGGETGGHRAPNGTSGQHGEASVDGNETTGNSEAVRRVTEDINGLKVTYTGTLSEPLIQAIAEMAELIATQITINKE